MKTYYVDSFTKERFKGNPAAVCFPLKELDEQSMLQVATEIGFSETAFLQETGIDAVYNIRFFSPRQEIPLCGHATLAAARILFDQTNLSSLCFITIEKIELTVRQEGRAIVMSFPYRETVPAEAPDAMMSALGIRSIIDARYSEAFKTIMLVMQDAMELKNLQPDFPALVNSYQGINGVLVTAPSGQDGYDYHYRYFWPWAGTNEDPVTGSVQSFLAVYWSEKLNKQQMNVLQSSPRTGTMSVTVTDQSVLISGEAVVMLTGDFFIEDPGE